MRITTIATVAVSALLANYGLAELVSFGGSDASTELENDDLVEMVDGRRILKRRRKNKKKNNNNNQWAAQKREEAKFLKTIPKNCYPKYTNQEVSQRICPNGQADKPAVCNDCDTKCAVRGDPHLAPAYSRCTKVIGSKGGRYIFFEIPGKISIEIDIFKVKQTQADPGYTQRSWVQRTFLDGELIADADYCDLKNTNETKKIIELRSNWASSPGKDITVTLEVGCTVERNHNARHLYIHLNINDPFSGYQIPVPKSMPPQGLTRYFKGARGACYDPIRYGRLPYNTGTDRVLRASSGTPDDSFFDSVRTTENDYKLVCTRKDTWKTTSLRKCKCKGSCGAWGDPHTTDMYHTSNPSHTSYTNFLTPFEKNENAPENFMYTFSDVMSVSHKLDDACKMIREVTVNFMKPEAKKSIFGCNPTSGTVGAIESHINTAGISGTWDTYTVKAKDACTKQGDEITIPSNKVAPEHKDETTGGFSLGKFAYLQSKGGNNPVAKLVPLVNRDTGPMSCVQKAGFSANEATNIVEMGSVSVKLMCSVNKRGEYYFNMCVNKQDMEVSQFIMDGSDINGRVSQWPTKSASWSGGMMQNVEKAGLSAGWCATGRISGGNGQQSFAAKTFQFRAANQQRLWFGSQQ